MKRHERPAGRFGLLLWLLGWSLLLPAGCREDASTASSSAEPSRANSVKAAGRDARSLLRLTFQRYRSSESYHDRGEVELVYRSDETTEQRTAPLAVAFDRGELEVSAYSLRLRHDAGGSSAWFAPPLSAAWDHQVVAGPSTGTRPDLDAWLTDPVVVAELSAGPAGPPPQLEWLFAADPMSKMFDQDADFDFVSSLEIDGRNCYAVRVRQGDERFVFHIDRRDSLIRRVELPTIRLPGRPAASTPDSAARSEDSIRLTLQLRAARFDAPAGSPTEDSFPERPTRVSRFVPPPPPAPHWIDRNMRSVTAVDHRGERFSWLASSRDRPLTVGLVVHATSQASPQSEASLDLLDRWIRQMPATLRGKLRIGVVRVDTPATRSNHRSPSVRGLDFAVSVDATGIANVASPDSLLIIDERADVQWLEPGFRAESLPGVGAVLADLTSGINVAAKIRERRDADRQAYRIAIARQQQ